MRSGERWLVIGAHDPYPARNGSALRIRQHLETLQRDGARVYYWGLAERAREKSDIRILECREWASLTALRKIAKAPRLLAGALRRLDPNVSFLFSEKRLWHLRTTIKLFRPTHLLVSESWMYRFIRRIQDNHDFHRVLDLHNVETVLRKEWSSRFKIVCDVRSWCMEKAERWLVQWADEVWVCSEVDRNQPFLAHAKIVPNKVHFDHYQRQPQTFGMVGIWSYAPNSKAADIILERIWPKLVDATPILVGRNPSEAMVKAVRMGAQVTGEVSDVRPYLAKIRTVVIPLLEGGGTRMKVLEAMAAGVPVVATEKALEGLEVRHLEHCIVSNPDDMADWVLKLWSDPLLEEKLRVRGKELVRDKYSW